MVSMPDSQTRRAEGAYRSFSGTRSGPLTAKTTQPQAPRENPFKIGDRVRTSFGTGTVVEIDGVKYLVALDGRETQLWERAWSLRKG